MITATYQKVLKKQLSVIVYFGVLLYTGFCLASKPAYNWDMLPYMGVILYYDSHDINAVHKQVYAAAKKQVPESFYDRMVDSSNMYRRSVAKDPAVFSSQMPFYVVKPLYTRMAWLFYKAGSRLSMATVWPSLIAWFLIGSLLFYWVSKYWSSWYSCMACGLLMLSPPLLTAASLSTPDALSALFIFASVYCAVERASIVTVYVLLVLAIFARLDNILPAAGFLSAIFFIRSKRHRQPRVKALLFSAGLPVACAVTTAGVQSFGWGLSFYPWFVKQLNASYTRGDSFSLSGYLTLMKSQFSASLYFSSLAMFFFLVVLFLRDLPAAGFNRLSTAQALSVMFTALIIIRFILQPVIADRFYLPYYLSIAAFLIRKQSLASEHHSL